MKCDQCENTATVHITDIISGKKNEVHFCEECANKLGATIEVDYEIPDLLGKLAQAIPMREETDVETSCNDCGISFAEFRNHGRFGCARDYQVFRDVLLPILEKIHGGVDHLGKVPSRANQSIADENLLIQKRNQLHTAIEKEEYERAAELRDPQSCRFGFDDIRIGVGEKFFIAKLLFQALNTACFFL